MKTPLGTIVPEPVAPREALEFFRSKGFAPPDARFDYRDWWGAEHARGFVVAKAMQDDVLETIRSHVDRALAEGRTLEQFRADLKPELVRLGWWGRQDMADPVTGEWREVQLGSSRRLRVIFDTNMRTAYAAGRWARIQRTKRTLPFLQYVQIQRPTRREDHAAWHEMVMRVDHPAWDMIYPPNGYFCGCIVRQLSAGAIERQGLTVTENPPIIMNAVPNNRTGRVDELPVGVTPGFAHNIGAAWLALSERHERITRAIPDVPLLPAELIGAERGLAIEALERGLRSGVEHLAALDLDSGDVLDWSAGTLRAVSPAPAAEDALRDPSRRIAVVHNHPSSRSFSAADLRSLGQLPGLDTLLAVGADGSVYRAGRAARMALGAVEFARFKAENEVWDRAIAIGMDLADADRLVGHAAWTALRIRGVLRYDAALAGGTGRALERFGAAAFDEIVARIARDLREEGL